MEGLSFQVDGIRLKVVIDEDAQKISIAKYDRQPFTAKDPLLVIDALPIHTIQFWMKIYGEQQTHLITPTYDVYLDGHLYGDGQLHGNGFGGRHWKYTTTDKYEIETWNMWYQGQVPEIFRPLFRVSCLKMVNP